MAAQGPYNPNGGMPQGQMPPQMPPGMSPQMQQQMQQMQAKQARRGTSKAVPIVVSAGLAVGVFCGLLFGVGVDKGEAAPPSKSHPMKKADGTDEVPAALQPTVNEGPKTPPKTGSATPAVASTGSGSAAEGSGSAVAAVAKPKLVIEIAPDTIAAGAKITVDGKEITGTSLEYEVDAATNKAKSPNVVVTVKAQGYKDAEQKVSLDGDTTVKFEMVKGKSTLPKDVAGAGSGSAATTTAAAGSAASPATTPATTTPPAGTQTAAKTTPPTTTTTPPTGTQAKTGTTPPTGTQAKTGTTPGTGSAAKTGTTPPTGTHHGNHNGSAKKPPGGLIDI